MKLGFLGCLEADRHPVVGGRDVSAQTNECAQAVGDFTICAEGASDPACEVGIDANVACALRLRRNGKADLSMSIAS